MEQLTTSIASVMDNAIINIAAGLITWAVVAIWRHLRARLRRNS